MGLGPPNVFVAPNTEPDGCAAKLNLGAVVPLLVTLVTSVAAAGTLKPKGDAFEAGLAALLPPRAPLREDDDVIGVELGTPLVGLVGALNLNLRPEAPAEEVVSVGVKVEVGAAWDVVPKTELGFAGSLGVGLAKENEGAFCWG